MSENEIPPPKATSSIPAPRGTSSIPASKQTSSIPLKKETVRVTLKASDAPPAAPGAPVVAATKPPMPTGIGAPPAPSVAPTAPAPTVGAPKAPAPAPTIALRPAGAPSAPAPAPTIRLNTPGAPTAPGAPARTVPLGAPAPGGATVSLPKATVQLQPPTQPLGTATPTFSTAPTIQTEDDESEKGQTAANILSIVGFLAAAAVLVIQFMTFNVWKVEELGLGQLFE